MATVAAADSTTGDEALYPIAVLIDELRNEDVQVSFIWSNIGQNCYNWFHCLEIQYRATTAG